MIIFLLILTSSVSSDDVVTYAINILPKVLCFADIKREKIVVDKISESNQIFTVLASSGAQKITAIFESSSSAVLLTWAETDDNSIWKFEKASPEVEKTAMHYMEMLINSIDPPKLVRITSHRSQILNGEKIHQLTLITELHERRSLQFLQFKFKANGRHTFIQHDVLLKDGEIN
ncbi:hypothetical protein TRFO_24791 [Tritrichomonas foetus]|uniref:Uncharacterized protein n=1 Tax=Tritrichomonas foetus TaxID=1144522 RepID=A0A1J4KBD2_9EUKA|nr:hypothetical protein TRFO_24791 [Tritrichomonas foetus]|eukprot:OHT06996.1 hypothetical protein TRFO_24791 [Tritrichomonas foetus]